MNKPNGYVGNDSEGTDDQSDCLEALKLSSISGDDHSVGNDTDGCTMYGLDSMYIAVGDNSINCTMYLMQLGDTLFIISKQGHGGTSIAVSWQPLYLRMYRHSMHT